LPDNESFDPLESLGLDSAGVNFDGVPVGSANLSATISAAHSSTTAEISSAESRLPSLPHSRLPSPQHSSPPPPDARSPSRGLTPAPTPGPTPTQSPSSSPARTSAANVIGMNIEPAGLNIAVPNSIIPPSPLPTTSGILPPALSSNMSTTTTRKRKNTNVDGRNSHGSKRPKSTGMAEQGGVEGSDNMDVDNVHPNGDEHGSASIAGSGVISPPATSADSLPARAAVTRAAATRAAATRAATTRAAAKASQSTSKPHGRKSRAASTAPLATGDEPAWFTKALAMLKSVDGGETWTKLLDVWSEFEAQEEYFGAPALDCVDRPLPLLLWIKQRRSPTWWPLVTQMVGFETSFMKWWLHLQPDWRVADGKVLRDLTGDFSVLKRSGLNGFLTLLVGLFYWHVTDEMGLEEDRLTIIEDCITIIKSFLHQ